MIIRYGLFNITTNTAMRPGLRYDCNPLWLHLPINPLTVRTSSWKMGLEMYK